MAEISIVTIVTAAVVGLYGIIVLYWQLRVLKGEAMVNPDGSVDSYENHPMYYGIAVADVFLACPLCIAALALVCFGISIGLALLAMAGFWLLWANTTGTVTSLRFHKPQLTVAWWFTFPFGAAVGIAAILVAIVP